MNEIRFILNMMANGRIPTTSWALAYTSSAQAIDALAQIIS